jgi:hypothetical protein
LFLPVKKSSVALRLTEHSRALHACLFAFIGVNLEQIWSAQACLRFVERGLPRDLNPRSKLQNKKSGGKPPQSKWI